MILFLLRLLVRVIDQIHGAVGRHGLVVHRAVFVGRIDIIDRSI